MRNILIVLMSTGALTACDTVTGPLGSVHQEGVHANAVSHTSHSAAKLPQSEIARLRAAVAKYHDIDKALADGYTLEFTGYRSQMGFHYLKAELLDDVFEIEKPEVLMYAPAPNGGLRFVGVEYAQPVDLQDPPPAPAGFTGDADEWALNTEFSVWTLHVWVGLHNPDGVFAPHNPRLP